MVLNFVHQTSTSSNQKRVEIADHRVCQIYIIRTVKRRRVEDGKSTIFPTTTRVVYAAAFAALIDDRTVLGATMSRAGLEHRIS